MIERSTTLAEAERFIQGGHLADELRDRARDEPDRVYLRDRTGVVTVGELHRRVEEAAAHLRRCGVDGSSRIAIAMPVEVDHVVLIFALLSTNALWIPLNPQLRGDPLWHQLRDSGASAVITTSSGPLREQLSMDGSAVKALPGAAADAPILVTVSDEAGTEPPGERRNACLLMYTSGTTGPPKGALVSETMLRAAVLGALETTAPVDGDVFYVWEPLFHIGGAQVVFVPLFVNVTLALAPRFSASRFWQDVIDFRVTHIHYLGGVLQILLQLPITEQERNNRVKVAWGAGATPEVRAACRERYAFALHECYGMTETSSIITVNQNELDGGVGRPLPWVDIAIGDVGQRGDGASADPVLSGEALADRAGSVGEVRVRGRVPGLLTEGYLGNTEAGDRARDGAWFRTGDLGRLDERGRLHFAGRDSDSIRVRGENISAWQIESVFGLHPDVDRCAVVGVDAQVGEQEMLLLFTAAEGRRADPGAVLAWGRSRLAAFQLPRYARIVEEMPLTPSLRIAKHRLPRTLEHAVQAAR